MKTKIGLISGSGKFPFLFAEAAKEKDYSVTSIAIKGNTDGRLAACVDEIHWFKITEFDQVLDFLRTSDIEQVAMAGQIKPHILFDRAVIEHHSVKKILAEGRDRRADSIFSTIANKISEAGITVLDSTLFLEKHLPKKGVE